MSAKSVVVIVTTSRADYGLLLPLMREMVADPDHFDVKVLVTGTHLSIHHGRTFDHFDRAVEVEYVLIPCTPTTDAYAGAALAIGSAITQITAALQIIKPDLMVVLGDRYEALAATIAAYTMRVPVAHIHGGEVTGGILDEGYRHAITKMSHLHLVAAEEFAVRVRRMGEEPDRVHVVGALGTSDLRYMPRELVVPFTGEYVLLCVHPETADGGSEVARAVANAMALLGTNRHDLSFVIFRSNADPMGHDTLTGWSRLSTLLGARRVLYVLDEPRDRYVNWMRYARVVVGNSSSGVIEAPAIGVPSIDVGSRQDGRPRAESVRHVVVDVELILRATEAALDEKTSFTDHAWAAQTDVARRICDVIRSTDLPGTLQKRFHDEG